MIVLYLTIVLLYTERSFKQMQGLPNSAHLNKIKEYYYEVMPSLWIALSTITTVGYGDSYPQTHIARGFGVIVCIFGQFLLSLMIVGLTMNVTLTPSEHLRYLIIKNDFLVQKQQEKAANVIKYALMLK